MALATLPEIAPRRMTAPRAISYVLAVLLAGTLLYYSLRGIEWSQVWVLIAGAKPTYLVLACVLSAGTLLVRAMRWRILLRAESEVAVSAAFWATAAGYFGNNFLPARGGELIRTFMISSRSDLSYAYVLTTALFERMSDAIALVVIAALVLLAMPVPPGWLAQAARPFAFLALCGIGAIVFLPRLDRVGETILARLPLPQTLHAKLSRLLEHSLRGVRAFHDVRRLLRFIAATILIWCMDAVGVTVVTRSLGLWVTPPAAFLLCAGLGLGSALPSTPGYVGIYQFVAVSVLTPFGFTRADAIADILLMQALSYFTTGCWGAVAFWQYRRMARP